MVASIDERMLSLSASKNAARSPRERAKLSDSENTSIVSNAIAR